MFKRIAIATAVGASIFGLAGVGASTLATASNNGTVQESNALTATCQAASDQTLDFSTVVDNQYVTEERVFQQSVEQSCGGEFVQFVLKMDNGAYAYSNKVWIPTSNVNSASQESFLLGGSTDLSLYGYAVYGNDLYPQLPADVCAADVTSTVVTVADQINGPGTDEAGAVTGTLPSCTNAEFWTPAS